MLYQYNYISFFNFTNYEKISQFSSVISFFLSNNNNVSINRTTTCIMIIRMINKLYTSNIYDIFL